MESMMAGAVPDREGSRPSERVIEAVAAFEGRDPTGLHPPLYTAIDPDALDALFSDGSSNGRCTVTFVYRGHEVTVDRDGAVRVDGE